MRRVEQPSLFPHVERHVRFSPCNVYRYRLGRAWASGTRLVFVLLNPSTADLETNDPTVERCERRARAWKFAGVEIVNLFALRSTDPKALREVADPVGPENDAAILEACKLGTVACGWGAHGSLHGRAQHVAELLTRAGHELHALDTNLDGAPRHPLYVAYGRVMKRWAPPFEPK